MSTLSGRVAVVTGASRGIGLAIARAYAAAGARVVLSSRTQESLDQAAASIRDAGGDAIGLAAHTGNPDAVNRLAEQAVAHYGGIDILVNNAATNPHFGPILTSEESQWDKTWEVNVKGYFRTARACVDTMEKRGGGKIINIASVAGKRPLPGMGVYCVSKAGVLMLTSVLAVELAGQNIQVNAIVPGFVKTRFSSAIWNTPAIYEPTLKLIPQGRMAEPDELAGLAVYLASSASDFVTGAAIPIDGGQLVASPMT